MNDIDKVKEVFSEGGYSCVLGRGNSVFTSRERGIKRIVDFCGESGAYRGFSAADKIVGRAAAFLYARMGVAHVYAQVLSVGGEKVLRKYGIEYEYDTLCSEIINRTGTDVCPMEKAVRNVEDCEEAYRVLLKKVTEKL